MTSHTMKSLEGPSEKRLRLIPGQTVPSDGSKKPLEFECSCGKRTWKPWAYYLSGHTKSCGRCREKGAEYWTETKFGKLRMSSPGTYHEMSGKKTSWACDCGNTTVLKISQVTTGKTSSCGTCSLLSAEHFASTRYGKLRMKEPAAYKGRSHEEVAWNCECGGETIASVANVTRELIKTCGKCNVLGEEHWRVTKYGKLHMKEPGTYHKGSDKVVAWDCDCGGSVDTRIDWVTKGDTRSCGKCNVAPASEWIDRKFGRLTLEVPRDLHRGSGTKTSWICGCGNRTSTTPSNVLRGIVKSCGECRDHVLKWYMENRETIRGLKTPIDTSKVPNGPFIVLETIRNKDVPFLSRCFVCGDEYRPMWTNIRNGRSLTCGCGSNKSSMAQREIAEFIRGEGREAILEHAVEGLKYDVYVPSSNLLIEYNGLRWHSSYEARKRDEKKYVTAVTAGHGFLAIFEDEWARTREKVENLIRNRIGSRRGYVASHRASKFEIRKFKSDEANALYDAHHYIGPCRTKLSYGIEVEGKLIACMSFSSPTRQSSHPWELVRMASDPGHRVHGIWSKMFSAFVREHSPSSVVSFSDNRLFPGGVYEKIGFARDGEIRPDYYWTRSGRRFHKSGLRKKGEERDSGLTERELREAQGYAKIWDLGKTRWVWRP